MITPTNRLERAAAKAVPLKRNVTLFQSVILSSDNYPPLNSCRCNVFFLILLAHTRFQTKNVRDLEVQNRRFPD